MGYVSPSIPVGNPMLNRRLIVDSFVSSRFLMTAEIDPVRFVALDCLAYRTFPGHGAGSKHAASLSERARDLYILLDQQDRHAAPPDAVYGLYQRARDS